MSVNVRVGDENEECIHMEFYSVMERSVKLRHLQGTGDHHEIKGPWPTRIPCLLSCRICILVHTDICMLYSTVLQTRLPSLVKVITGLVDRWASHTQGEVGRVMEPSLSSQSVVCSSLCMTSVRGLKYKGCRGLRVSHSSDHRGSIVHAGCNCFKSCM